MNIMYDNDYHVVVVIVVVVIIFIIIIIIIIMIMTIRIQMTSNDNHKCIHNPSQPCLNKASCQGPLGP